MESLRGQLLISAGGLFDPNFRHTVVLIGEHNAEGAVGVVLNRALPVPVHEAVPALAPLVAADARLHEGGPVQPQSAVILAEFTHPEFADLLVFGSVGFMTGDVPADTGAAVRRARVFLGHSGWGAGQLEAELAQDSWIIEPAREEDVFTEEPESLWRRVLERKGPAYRRLSKMPFDPKVN